MMSGRSRATHSQSWAVRARIPLTFQVAIFTRDPNRVAGLAGAL
jgi:hypothetical protein